MEYFDSSSSAWPYPKSDTLLPTAEQCCEWCRGSWDCVYWELRRVEGVSDGFCTCVCVWHLQRGVGW